MIIRNISHKDYYNYIKLENTNISQQSYNDFITNVLGYFHVILVVENK